MRFPSIQYSFPAFATMATVGGLCLGSYLAPPIQPVVFPTRKTETPNDTPEAPPKPTHSKHTEDSYTYVQLSRGFVYPLTNSLVDPFASYMDAKGGYWMNYSFRTQDPRNPMFDQKINRIFFSRKSEAGRWARGAFLPAEYNGRPLTASDQVKLRQDGAMFRSWGNYLTAVPHALRLGTNVIALNELAKNGKGNGLLEKAVVMSDTAAVVGHCTDIPLYAYGLGQISRGNEAGAVPALMGAHRVNIVSNTIQMLTGGLRIYTESQRNKLTGKSNPSVYLYSFLDIGMGLYFGLLSLYLLRRVRQFRRSKEGADVQAQNNILLCITKIPTSIQDSMRLFAAFGAASGIGVNATLFYHSMLTNSMLQQYADRIATSSSLGLLAGGFAFASALLYTPASLPIARAFWGFNALFLSAQTLHDLWPNLKELF
ncbi:MAG: hypothetical protein ABH871_05460 [Pseudomonadota bacterium]